LLSRLPRVPPIEASEAPSLSEELDDDERLNR
jgi:hypothetical protein